LPPMRSRVAAAPSKLSRPALEALRATPQAPQGPSTPLRFGPNDAGGEWGFPFEISCADPRSQKRDLGHPSICSFDFVATASQPLGMTNRDGVEGRDPLVDPRHQLRPDVPIPIAKAKIEGRYPGFPVEVGGGGVLHAAFF
jgi:hypothetical protein